METLPLHPKLVHLPMALAVLMPLIAGGLLLAWWRDVLPRRAWWGAVLLQAALMVSGLASFNTGERDEERVEAVVGDAPIETHEEAATMFLIGGGVTLALLLAAALVPLGLARTLALAGTLSTVAVLWLGVRVGEAGGKLVYQHNAGAAFSQPAIGGAPGGGPGAAPGAARPDRDDDD